MRRGVGVAAIKRREEDAKALQEASKVIRDNDIENAKQVVSTFRGALEEFAVKYRDRINK